MNSKNSVVPSDVLHLRNILESKNKYALTDVFVLFEEELSWMFQGPKWNVRRVAPNSQAPVLSYGLLSKTYKWVYRTLMFSFLCICVWVWVFPDIKWGTQTEGVWGQGAERSIWTKGRGWRKLRNEAYTSWSAPSGIRVVKSVWVRWAGYIAGMAEERKLFGLMARKSEGKRPQ